MSTPVNSERRYATTLAKRVHTAVDNCATMLERDNEISCNREHREVLPVLRTPAGFIFPSRRLGQVRRSLFPECKNLEGR